MDGGDQAMRLTSARSRENQAAITPDGQAVIYTSSESGFQALWKVSIAGGDPIQLTQRPARKAAISPDGKLIACEYADDPQKGWAVVIPRQPHLEDLAFLSPCPRRGRGLDRPLVCRQQGPALCRDPQWDLQYLAAAPE